MRAPNVRLSHSVIVRAPGLLPMLYSVSELAAAIGVVERTLRDWLAYGVPHHRDVEGRIWVNGREFANWVQSMRRPQRTRRMKDDQAYCLHCKKVVELIELQTRRVRGKLTNTRGTCSLCGRMIHRGGRLASDLKSLVASKGP